MSDIQAILHTDGGARGNPGPAGIGYVLVIEDDAKIEHGEYIGEKTNNYAEYMALIKGLERAHQEKVTDIKCYLDSELVVKQLKGQYRVKHPDLKPLFEQVKEVAEDFNTISYTHIPRAKNKGADKLVNWALDKAK
ncbi:MAG: ribonuclease HI family protein [Candidatus Andersenbacteria bacterium]